MDRQNFETLQLSCSCSEKVCTCSFMIFMKIYIVQFLLTFISLRFLSFLSCESLEFNYACSCGVHTGSTVGDRAKVYRTNLVKHKISSDKSSLRGICIFESSVLSRKRIFWNWHSNPWKSDVSFMNSHQSNIEDKRTLSGALAIEILCSTKLIQSIFTPSITI